MFEEENPLGGGKKNVDARILLIINIAVFSQLGSSAGSGVCTQHKAAASAPLLHPACAPCP